MSKSCRVIPAPDKMAAKFNVESGLPDNEMLQSAGSCDLQKTILRIGEKGGIVLTVEKIQGLW